MESHDEKLRGLTQKTDPLSVEENSKAIILKSITANWELGPKHTLDGINIEIMKGQLCAIIGPVGAGKVKILNRISKNFNEYKVFLEFSFTIASGRIAYFRWNCNNSW